MNKARLILLAMVLCLATPVGGQNLTARTCMAKDFIALEAVHDAMLLTIVRADAYYRAEPYLESDAQHALAIEYLEQAAATSAAWLEIILPCQEAIDMYLAFTHFHSRLSLYLLFRDHDNIDYDIQAGILEFEEPLTALIERNRAAAERAGRTLSQQP